MAETCGGCGYLTNRAPVQNPIQKIRDLESKAQTEGLTTRERVDLVATKIDNSLGNCPQNGIGEKLNYMA